MPEEKTDLTANEHELDSVLGNVDKALSDEASTNTKEVESTSNEYVDEALKDADEKSGVDDKRSDESEVDRLRRELAERDLVIKRLANTDNVRGYEPPKKDKEPEVKPYDPEIDLTDDEHTALLQGRDGAVKVFKTLAKRVYEDARKQALLDSASYVTNYVTEKQQIDTATQQFYARNKDLVPHARFVGFVANQVTSRHPDWSIGQVLTEVEKEARAELKLQKQASDAEDKRSPSFNSSPTGGRVRRPAPPKSKEAEVFDTLFPTGG